VLVLMVDRLGPDPVSSANGGRVIAFRGDVASNNPRFDLMPEQLGKSLDELQSGAGIGRPCDSNESSAICSRSNSSSQGFERLDPRREQELSKSGQCE
jgi:hypothetical protein